MHNLKIVKIFLIVVFFFIVVAIAIRITSLISKSKFDSRHQFTVQISSTDQKKEYVTQTITFNPDKHSVSVLSIVLPKNKANELEMNPKDFYTKIGKYIKIPVDEVVQNAPGMLFPMSSDKKENIQIDSKLLSLFASYGSYKTQLSLYDLLQMWWFARSVSANDISFEKIQLPLDDQSIDKITSGIFTDSSFEQEDQDIEIINSSEISGLGNRLARLVTTMGGNVVSVSTSRDPANTSIIFIKNEKKYTHEKLEKILGFPVEESTKNSIADVIIVIGKDKLSSNSF